MAKESSILQMVITIRECMKMAILMAMGSIYGKTSLYIKVISSKDYEKGQACGLIKKEISIKDLSKETRKTEKELLIGQTEIFTKASLLMI